MKPSIPKGTRDFSPVEMQKRNFIFDTLRQVFRLYGYQQIETPAMENLSTLLGKYGEEGDKLLFRILNSGDFLSDVKDSQIVERNLNQLSALMCEKGLRYDLTVPLARYVVQNRDSINFPFKRFQIQPVWRADRPQKGRYREFYQCDVDVIGSESLLNEAELIQIIDEGFQRLGLKVVIKMNNRKVLSGISEIIGEPGRLAEITIAIDKIDKIGLQKVKEELVQRGLANSSIEKLEKFLTIEQKDNGFKLNELKNLLSESVTGIKGLEELSNIYNYLNIAGISAPVEFDLTLARGLSYYTGAIFEVKSLDAEMGSICGGGRYDDLTGIFGLPDVSGVGISFGADRIYDVMNSLNLFPSESAQSTQIMFVNFGPKEELYCLPLVKKLRQAGVKTELYAGFAKMNKQMNYANTRKIPYVAIIGEEEIKNNDITLKNMSSGDQGKVSFEELVPIILRNEKA